LQMLPAIASSLQTRTSRGLCESQEMPKLGNKMELLEMPDSLPGHFYQKFSGFPGNDVKSFNRPDRVSKRHKLTKSDNPRTQFRGLCLIAGRSSSCALSVTHACLVPELSGLPFPYISTSGLQIRKSPDN
jgi:hypothetical protein